MSPRAVFLALVLPVLLAAAPARAADDCVPVAGWLAPGGQRLAASEVLARAAKASVVLLGETHDSAEHHRWQLQMIAALHAQRPNMVLGFESFPRRVQPALDRWVAGELSEAEFLAQSDWRNVWRMDPQLYLPLFHFARMNRIPMVALNVESSLTREITQKGYDAVPAEKREGVGRPAPPTDAYLDWLVPIWAGHERPGGKPAKVDRNDPEFRRFVESQQTWDRAMAEVLASAAKRPGAPLV
ncbi:MAG: signal protein, partial [Proteobacteria bacterium]|nr:signal protein [Pseudomonadota bacterium]